MPYSERLRFESELLPEPPLLEEPLPEPEFAEPAIVVPVEDPLVLSVVLPSLLEDEPDLALVEDDLDPEAVVLLLPLFAEVDEEVVPEAELEPEPEFLFVPKLLLPLPLLSLLSPPPLLLLLLLAVLPDDVDALGVLDELLDELPDELFASFEV